MAMNGVTRVLAVAAFGACAVALCGSLEYSRGSVAPDPTALLAALRASLAEAGLRQRQDVVVEMNHRPLAIGFSRAGCAGLLLVAILPHTAQSWLHIAPRLDLAAFELGYLYNGMSYPAVPRLERLAGGLLRDLGRHQAGLSPQVVAIAEAGSCGLSLAAAPALEAISRGRLPPAGQSGSPHIIGDNSK